MWHFKLSSPSLQRGLASLVMTKPPPSDGDPAVLPVPPEPPAPLPFGFSIDVAEQPSSRPNAIAAPAARRDRQRRLWGERHQDVIELREGVAAMTGRRADL